MDKPIDTLIVGGPAVTCTMPCATIRLLPLTLEGLAAAYRLLPQCKAAVVAPTWRSWPTMSSCEITDRSWRLGVCCAPAGRGPQRATATHSVKGATVVMSRACPPEVLHLLRSQARGIALRHRSHANRLCRSDI
jgi:hypothetical protein